MDVRIMLQKAKAVTALRGFVGSIKKTPRPPLCFCKPIQTVSQYAGARPKYNELSRIRSRAADRPDDFSETASGTNGEDFGDALASLKNWHSDSAFARSTASTFFCTIRSRRSDSRSGFCRRPPVQIATGRSAGRRPSSSGSVRIWVRCDKRPAIVLLHAHPDRCSTSQSRPLLNKRVHDRSTTN
jgi:hypothetical protein